MPHQVKQRLIRLLKEFSHIFPTILGNTNLLEHQLEVKTENPIRIKPYPIPIHYLKEVEKEIDKLENMGIITRSSSNYCSPIVIIRRRTRPSGFA